MTMFFEDKKVLVTGGCGTVGKELVHQLVHKYAVKELVVLDNNESELFYQTETYSDHANVHFYLCDIRDESALTRKMEGVDLVFHTAAFKHVILCEQVPHEAVQTNILGVDNVVRAAVNAGVSKVIFTSSDKAVNPTNVMGTSKLMGERLITAANVEFKKSGCIFASTRFGNVLGSRGSVIPIFREQLRKGGPLTLTHHEMTRFIMSVEQSVQLIIDSAMLAKGGEVFVTKMPVISIKDLAEVMIRKLAAEYDRDPSTVEIKEIGVKPGEKLYEELMTGEETGRAIELEHYFVIKPAIMKRFTDIDYSYQGVLSTQVDNPYNSANEPKLSQEELGVFLVENNLI
ncbi:polysaccharide biosynthesis protein [Aquipseudomonas campi]|uniref:Polysaccharide biosynthesis protein n=1 Tax=Aquipseudomonas campi TaxID=2731681 RepID=A0A6M8FA91_9GAMM|nr:SDR family NAD(P)-dependent oxidoreductase [Pseudomonas campi]QKE65794.1 polysaccharide biosynthesis protein [Pseudomonas campi]